MAISRLQILFSTVSVTFVFAGFIVDKLKRQTTFGGFNLACLMQFKAFAQIVLLLGGIVGLFGVVAFSRRELATAQNQS